MKILFIVSSLYKGGAERVVARVASMLSNKHEVHIFLTHPSRERYPVDSRVIIYELPSIKIGKPFRGRKRSYLRKKAISDYKKKHDIDCTISFMNMANFDNICTHTNDRKIISIRCMVYPTMQSYSKKDRWISNFQHYMSALKADQVVGVSRQVCYEQVHTYHANENKVVTIYNPCNIQKVQELSNNPLEDEKFISLLSTYPRCLITMGRIVEQKGHWHLVRAFKNIAEQYPDTCLVILGEGDLEDTIREVIRANGLENRVYLAGFHPVPYPYLKRAYAYVCPSLFEGFSNAVIEAMACGLPILSADCDSGPRELLAPASNYLKRTNQMEITDYGILFPVCSGVLKNEEPLEPQEIEMEKAMSYILQHPDKRAYYVQKNNDCLQTFTPEHILEQWKKVIENR